MKEYFSAKPTIGLAEFFKQSRGGALVPLFQLFYLLNFPNGRSESLVITFLCLLRLTTK
jgi:hypothetical protein